MRFGPLAILGDPEPGKTLMIRTGGVVAHADLVQGSEGFQWLRDGQPIPGETLRAYTVQDDDTGRAISVVYSFRAHGEDQQVISKPELVPDPVSDAIAALYFLIFDREPDALGLRFYAGLYRNGVKLSFLVADMERNKAAGAK